MPDVPNTRFINLTDSPAAINYDKFGEAFVTQLSPSTGGLLDIHEFRKVSVMIGTTKATACVVTIGKLTNTTLAMAFNQPLDSKIHTYDIVGPEMSVLLKGGAPNTQEHLQVWVYLRS